jgi:hypothetical protein
MLRATGIHVYWVSRHQMTSLAFLSPVVEVRAKVGEKQEG